MPISRHALNDAAQRFGTPLYVYDEAELGAALRRVQRAFGTARLLPSCGTRDMTLTASKRPLTIHSRTSKVVLLGV